MARTSSSSKKGAQRAAKDGAGLRGNAGRAEQPRAGVPDAADAGAGRDIAGVVLAVAAVASFLAVVSPSSAPVTAIISQFYHLGFGLGAYVLPFVLLAGAVGLFLRDRSPLSGRVVGGAALVFTAVLAIITLLVPTSSLSANPLFDDDHLSASGGYLGAFVASALQTAFGTSIALVLLVGMAVAGLVIIGFSVSGFVRALIARIQTAVRAAQARRQVEVNRAPWGEDETAAEAARTTLIDGRGQQRAVLDDDAGGAPPTTYLGSRKTTVLDRGAEGPGPRGAAGAATAGPADEDDDDENPLVDLSAQLESERAAARAAEHATTRLIPVKERYVEVEQPVEVPYSPSASIGVAPTMPTISDGGGHFAPFVDLPDEEEAPHGGEDADGSAGTDGFPPPPALDEEDAFDDEAELPPFVDLPDDEMGEDGDPAPDVAPAVQEDPLAPADEPADAAPASTGSAPAIPSFLLSHAGPAPDPAPIGAHRADRAPSATSTPSKHPASTAAPAPVPERPLPPVSMLRHNPHSASAASSEQELEQTAQALQSTLTEFGLHARVTGWISGPTVTTFKVQPGEGERVSRISNLEDDIALSLAAQSVRIFAPIPGTSLVGIEIPNAKRQNVYLADVLPYVKGGPLELAVGRDAEGTPVVADLAKMPHLLIAGTTGSGKSVMINSIVMTLLMRTRPEDVRLIMVDPKRVELAGYNGLPHLYVPVVTEPKQAASALAWAVSEMERRLKVFERLSVRKISTYNEKQQAGEFAHYDNPPQKMPYLVIIIDELSDLMMVAGKDVEASIVRIAQLGRAAGIHLIVATQRPSSNVVTGLIKANITNRIAFNVATGVDSRVIIDQTGAEKLTGLGDMLFSKVGWGKPKRIQGCFVSDEEICQVVEFVKSHGETDYHEEILSAVAPAAFSNGGGGAPERTEDDPLLWEAAHIVVDSQLGSTSGLQRRLKVGYARAGRIMDMLEEKGVVGPPDGSKPREVLLDEEGLAALEALEGPLSSEEVEGF